MKNNTLEITRKVMKGITSLDRNHIYDVQITFDGITQQHTVILVYVNEFEYNLLDLEYNELLLDKNISVDVMAGPSTMHHLIDCTQNLIDNNIVVLSKKKINRNRLCGLKV